MPARDPPCSRGRTFAVESGKHNEVFPAGLLNSTCTIVCDRLEFGKSVIRRPRRRYLTNQWSLFGESGVSPGGIYCSPESGSTSLTSRPHNTCCQVVCNNLLLHSNSTSKMSDKMIVFMQFTSCVPTTTDLSVTYGHERIFIFNESAKRKLRAGSARGHKSEDVGRDVVRPVTESMSNNSFDNCRLNNGLKYHGKGELLKHTVRTILKTDTCFLVPNQYLSSDLQH